jgi:SCP-2 sterol transfer family
MATVAECREALDRLADALLGVDAEARAKHLPRRTIRCTIKDLDTSFTARIDESGVHDIAQMPPSMTDPPSADIKVSVRSDDLVAIANGEDNLLAAWLHGRAQISAPMRDLLRLRSLVGF